jgi:hypothetical protein
MANSQPAHPFHFADLGIDQQGISPIGRSAKKLESKVYFSTISGVRQSATWCGQVFLSA